KFGKLFFPAELELNGKPVHEAAATGVVPALLVQLNFVFCAACAVLPRGRGEFDGAEVGFLGATALRGFLEERPCRSAD
ncbi:MAG TPA: hypothetical protein VLA17_05820, partial [Candidatus Limnocylindria bacterium]|nr:hypothetical protein [Candidatus Limnocylindria bacterium]